MSDPGTEGATPGADVDDLASEVAGMRGELSKIIPHLLQALKRQDAVQALTDRLSAAEKELAQRRAVPALLGVARALHRVRAMDLPADAKVTLEEELEQILANGGLTEFGSPGDEFDPARHEPLQGQVSAGGRGRVTTVHASGLTMGALILLPAKVSIEPIEANDNGGPTP